MKTHMNSLMKSATAEALLALGVFGVNSDWARNVIWRMPLHTTPKLGVVLDITTVSLGVAAAF